MNNYLCEHSVGSIVRSSFTIFGRNFLTIFLIYTLPTFPGVFAQMEAQRAGDTTLLIVAVLFNVLMGTIAFSAITVAISDICLGNRLGVIQSYRKIMGFILGKLFYSNILQILAVTAGFVLLVIPGLVLTIWLMFTSVIVVLENTWGIAALKRSANLGKGYQWRNAGVLLVMMCVTAVIMGVFFGMSAFLAGTHIVEQRGLTIILSVFQLGITYPLLFISIILLYYDLRVRKEAYDIRALAEDLRR